MMRRGLLILFTIFLTLIVAAWLRSYRFAEGVEAADAHGSFLVTTHPAELHVYWPSPVTLDVEPKYFTLEFASTPHSGGFAKQSDVDGRRFAYGQTIMVNGSAHLIRFAQAPFWALALLAGLWPGWALSARIWRPWRRRSGGLCRWCGYDLRATPDRCPECGRLTAPNHQERYWRRWCAGTSAVVALLLAAGWISRHDFHAAGCRPIDFATLGNFLFDDSNGKTPEIPLPIRRLLGQRIIIDGYMMELWRTDYNTEFMLMPRRNLEGCHVLVFARIINDQCANYNGDLLRVRGTLRRVQAGPDTRNFLWNIYYMTVDSIQPAPQPTP
jgi:hypothetical protein